MHTVVRGRKKRVFQVRDRNQRSEFDIVTYCVETSTRSDRLLHQPVPRMRRLVRMNRHRLSRTQLAYRTRLLIIDAGTQTNLSCHSLYGKHHQRR